MKTAEALTPSSREASSGGGDSFYFPECRKDTNCHCAMCIASINATLDLVSARSIKAPPTPDRTPARKAPAAVEAGDPALFSTAKSRPTEEEEGREKAKKGKGRATTRWVVSVCMCLVLLVDLFAVGWVVGDGARLEGEVVRRLGEGVAGGGDLKEVLGALEERLSEEFGALDVRNCSSDENHWILQKDGHLLRMKCVLFKSMVEELSIWGFPLRTSGLLVTGLSSRSFTLLSGHIYEWFEDKLEFHGKKAGSSWTCNQWREATVQLAANSWILEYHQSPLLQERRLLPFLRKLLSLRFSQHKEDLNYKISRWLTFPEFVRSLFVSVEDNAPPT